MEKVGFENDSVSSALNQERPMTVHSPMRGIPSRTESSMFSISLLGKEDWSKLTRPSDRQCFLRSLPGLFGATPEVVQIS